MNCTIEQPETQQSETLNKVKDEDHDFIVLFLSALHAAVCSTLKMLGRGIPKDPMNSSLYTELFGRGQELLIDEHLAGKLTDYLVRKYLPYRLLDSNTENENIRIPASTNRSREARGDEPYRIEYETPSEPQRASLLCDDFHPACFDPDKDADFNPAIEEVDPEFNQLALMLINEKQLNNMNATQLIIYLFCTEDDVDRAIVKACLKDFDEDVYDRDKDKKSQDELSEELGIPSSTIQRRLAAINQRFKKIRRRR